MPGSFFDSNVLLYVASRSATKAGRAEKLIAVGGTISVQVLNEIANVGRRKMSLSWAELRDFLAAIRALVAVTSVTAEIHDTGLKLAERYELSIFDAMIAASALHAGCDVLWSEDMQHGLLINKTLRIANPFR